MVPLQRIQLYQENTRAVVEGYAKLAKRVKNSIAVGIWRLWYACMYYSLNFIICREPNIHIHTEHHVQFLAIKYVYCTCTLYIRCIASTPAKPLPHKLHIPHTMYHIHHTHTYCMNYIHNFPLSYMLHFRMSYTTSAWATPLPHDEHHFLMSYTTSAWAIHFRMSYTTSS